MSRFPPESQPTPHPGPLAPPTTPGALSIPDRPAAWPSVLGIVCIVLGALGTLGGLWGVASSVMMMTGAMPVQTMGAGPATPDIAQSIRTMAPMQIVAEALKFLCGSALMLVGWFMYRRRPVARPAAVWWSIAKIVVALGSTAIAAWMQYVIMTDISRAVAADPSAPAQMQGVMTGMMAATIGVMVVWGIVWGCALPVFMLVWFSRAGVRAEVARWADRQHGWVS